MNNNKNSDVLENLDLPNFKIYFFALLVCQKIEHHSTCSNLLIQFDVQRVICLAIEIKVKGLHVFPSIFGCVQINFDVGWGLPLCFFKNK